MGPLVPARTDAPQSVSMPRHLQAQQTQAPHRSDCSQAGATRLLTFCLPPANPHVLQHDLLATCAARANRVHLRN
ncbi:hypothetical protein AEA00_20010 [Xanthomonas campestris pv. campestris]|nr:hypothetical protein AEA00_20010 [Xanthomonas campestris pv. campestris]